MNFGVRPVGGGYLLIYQVLRLLLYVSGSFPALSVLPRAWIGHWIMFSQPPEAMMNHHCHHYHLHSRDILFPKT